MPPLVNEQVLVTSDDQQITLTDHRIIYTTSQSAKEIALKDITGYELRYKREGVLFYAGIATLIIGLLAFPNDMLIVYLVALVFMILYFIFSTKMLKISTATYSMEMPVNGFSTAGLQQFIDRIMSASKNRKGMS